MKRFNIKNNVNGLEFSFEGKSIDEVFPFGVPVEWGKDFSISEKDITSEKDAQIAKSERLAALRDKHAAMKPQDLDTIVELRQAVMELQEILGIK